MELYNINDSMVINDGKKCLNILSDSDYKFWITGDKKDKKLPGMSFKITEHDRLLYKAFSVFYDSLCDEYNSFKEFHDYNYEEYPLYDKKHNWFTFYDDYSNINDGNIFRIIRNETKDPYVIGIYIRNKNNKLQSHTIAKAGSKYPEFGYCFERLLFDLRKLEKEKTYTKKKEV